MENSQLKASERLSSATSFGERVFPSRQPQIDLRAKAETARRVFGSGGICALADKTFQAGRSWISRWGRSLWITRCARRLWWTMRMRANDGVCSVEIATDWVGFFGQLSWCLHIFQYCERHGLIPDLRLTGKVYLDQTNGLNWLDHYFDLMQPITLEEITKRVRYTKKISDLVQMGPPIAPQMSLDDGARLLRKYLRPKPHISKIVEDYWISLGIEGPVLGVHFRGTDKSEGPRVSWQHCLRTLEDYLRNDYTIKAVFVASDEQGFIDFMKKSVTSPPVYSHDDHYRSNSDRPIHTDLKNGAYEKGEDALVNALLLSKCSIVIRTTSFLSAWASIFNPELKVVLVNKPYDKYLWYPESEILKAHHTRYLPEA
jgi:hypothetical protein